MKTTATMLSALLLALGGIALAGCTHQKTQGPGPKTTGLNEKPPQPTTGTQGTRSPTPATTTSSG